MEAELLGPLAEVRGFELKILSHMCEYETDQVSDGDFNGG